ncbi:MAG TPA: SAM-dependent methyltransferase [Spirochaetia bacterium]|nr:SAM-dependent methyltransferase [Spirochaetia bacterium]
MSVFDLYPQEYDSWFIKNPGWYESELEAVRKMLPEKGKGVEIGAGTGKFAVPLKIETGVEISKEMGKKAEENGLKMVYAMAENLPFMNHSFDFSLMVTTFCFLKNPLEGLKEAYRILKPGGVFINAIVDKESPLGKIYVLKKEESRFYREAFFYSVDETVELMKKAGFKDFEYRQTIHDIENKNFEPSFPGYGKGSFVVIKCIK